MSFRSQSRQLLVVLAAGLAIASPAAASNSRLEIPKLGLDVPLAAQLEDGPKLYYQDTDTLAIAGHRTTHSHPFLQLPRLRPGDLIRVAGKTYKVRRTTIVKPHEIWVLRYQGLVLSACHPAGSATYRYIVFAAPA